MQVSLCWFESADMIQKFRKPGHVGDEDVVASLSMGALARTLAPPVIAAQFVAIMVGAVNDNAYVVSSDHAWTENGFLLAVRSDPLIVLGLLTSFVMMASLIGRTRLSYQPSGHEV